MVHHTPRNGNRGFPDERNQHRGIRATGAGVLEWQMLHCCEKSQRRTLSAIGFGFDSLCLRRVFTTVVLTIVVFPPPTLRTGA
jgi:hypothetical protein